MRRILSGSFLALAVGATAFLSQAPSTPSASADTLTSIAAVPADSVVDGYGVGIHLAFLNTPYQDASATADALADLGVRHVRDDLYMNNPRQYAGIGTVAAKGIHFDLITGNPSSPDSPAAYIDTIATKLPAGAVESVEGSNEWDLFSGGSLTWAADLMARQQQLYQATKANPATANLPVLSPALAFKWNYAALGNLTPYSDYANAHMYPGGYLPSNQLSQISTAVRGVVGSTKPLITTEAGYNNAVNTTSTNLPVPEDVAGVYTPRILLEHILNGDKRVYTYELVDEFDDPGKTDVESNWGLMRHDWTPKPAYTAMKNLLGLVSDAGPAFTPTALPVKVAGFPGDGKYLLTQKRNGQYVLFLWRNVSIYDPATKQPQTVTPTNVTLQLAKSTKVSVYRPSSGTAPVSTTTGTSVPLQMDGAVTAVTLDNPPAPAPQNVQAVAGASQTASVSWTLPATGANVTGISITSLADGATTTLPATATSWTATGLANGTGYAYRVQALSPDGNSDPVTTGTVVPGTPPPAPKVTSAKPGSGSVALGWRKSSDANAPVTAYELSSGASTLQVSASTLQATLTGLAKKAKVRVGIRALNALGWSPYAYSSYVTTKK
jgi:hypothetical protein